MSETLCKEINTLQKDGLSPKKYLERAEEIAHGVLSRIDPKILSTKRGLGITESTSLADLKELKKTMGEFKGEIHYLQEDALKDEQQATTTAVSDSSNVVKSAEDWDDEFAPHLE